MISGLISNSRGTRRAGNLFHAWIALCLLVFTGQAWAELTLSSSSVTLPAKTYATLKVSGASGAIRAESANTAVAKVTL